jgi:hypothetical protein
MLEHGFLFILIPFQYYYWLFSVYNVVRQDGGIPAVPLVIIGIEP